MLAQIMVAVEVIRCSQLLETFLKIGATGFSDCLDVNI